MKQYFRIAIWIFVLASPTLGQSLVDSNLSVQAVVTGLNVPTGIAFLPNGNDAFVIQKNDGQVRLIRNGAVAQTVLDLPVANNSERGLLGIALNPNFATNGYVYLYHTAAAIDGGPAINNRIDRYHWNGANLTFDLRIRDLGALPGPNHAGGKLAIGPDGKLYAAIGDLNRDQRAQNNENSGDIRRPGTILRLNKGGLSPTDNPFYNAAHIGTVNESLNDIYAYGIRNSFGLAFDPATGNLWDTENGPEAFDEINLVRAGFNSGWRDIMGPRSRNGGTTGTLVSLGSAAYYVEPKFNWKTPVAPTDLHFVESPILGSEYQNDLFVGDVNTGSLYHFDLEADRRRLVLGGALSDRVADNSGGNLLAEQDSILFGSGFGVISDILTGTDGMYVLSLSNGALYRITNDSAFAQTGGAGLNPATDAVIIPLPPAAAMGGIGLLIVVGIFTWPGAQTESGIVARTSRA